MIVFQIGEANVFNNLFHFTNNLTNIFNYEIIIILEILEDIFILFHFYYLTHYLVLLMEKIELKFSQNYFYEI